MQETWVWSLGQEDPLEKEMATHSTILAWGIPWTEEPGRVQFVGLARVGCNLATKPPPPLLRWLYDISPYSIEVVNYMSSFSNVCFLFKMKVTQLYLTLCDSMDFILPGSSVHGISQARIMEWVAIPFSRGSFWPRDQTQVSCIAGRCFTIWSTFAFK